MSKQYIEVNGRTYQYEIVTSTFGKFIDKEINVVSPTGREISKSRTNAPADFEFTTKDVRTFILDCKI